jgi:ribosomal protein S18 acetylase RimI-like enzyme
MAELEVRPASDDDIESVEPLLEDALTRLRSLRGAGALLESLQLDVQITPSELARVVCGASRADVVAYVAVLDESVAAVAVGFYEQKQLVLMGVHTSRSLRRRRIGTALLDEMRAHAARAGEQFEAVALPGDQTLKSLLESAGFKARLLRLSAER